MSWFCVNCGSAIRNGTVQPSADASGKTATGLCSGTCRNRVGAVSDPSLLGPKRTTVRSREQLPDDTWGSEHWVRDSRGREWIDRTSKDSL